MRANVLPMRANVIPVRANVLPVLRPMRANVFTVRANVLPMRSNVISPHPSPSRPLCARAPLPGSDLGCQTWDWPECVFFCPLFWRANVLPVSANVLPIRANALPTRANVIPIRATVTPMRANGPSDANVLPVRANVLPIRADLFPLRSNVISPHPSPSRPLCTCQVAVFAVELGGNVHTSVLRFGAQMNVLPMRAYVLPMRANVFSPPLPFPTTVFMRSFVG